MLHLGPGFIGHLVAAARRALTDAQAAQQAGEGGILHVNTFLFGQFFVHPLDPAPALLVEALEHLRIDGVLGGADQLGQLAPLGDDHRHRVATDAQAPSDLSQRHAFLVEQKNRLTLVRFDHGVASSCG